MSIDYPLTTPGLAPASFQWGSEPRTLAYRSVFNGGIRTSGMPGARWTASMVISGTGRESDAQARAARREAFFHGLNGQAERVNIWPFHRIGRNGQRGWPRGTIATSGIQINANAAQFATSATLKNMGAGATLEAGDFWKIDSTGQLIMNPARVIADGSGVATVVVPDGLRAAIAANMSVTVVRPTAQFIMADPNWRGSYNVHGAQEFAVDWIEVFP